MAHWRSSGLPANVYVAENNLSADRLRYWSARISREAQGARLLPVRAQQQPITAAAPLELRSPSGWLMRIEDTVNLQSRASAL